MNLVSALDFGLAALNFGVTIVSIFAGSQIWWVSLACGVFCFCMGLSVMDK